jgi:K+-transporting ATPase ATPase A chain
MAMSEWLQIGLFFVLLLALVKPLGGYMAGVYSGEKTFLSPVVRPVESFLYRLTGASPDEEMNWKQYTLAVLMFNMAGIVFLYLILRLQHVLPFNTSGMQPIAPDQAFNAAVSFVTNTNWQSFSGEASMSIFSQMVGFTVQNFLSAATGMAVMMALIRDHPQADRQPGQFLG